MIKNTWEILCRVSRNSRQSFKMLFRFLEKWKISLFDFKLLSIHWNDLSFSIDSNEIQSLHLCCQSRWIALFKYEINSIHLSGSCMKHSLKCFYSLDKTVYSTPWAYKKSIFVLSRKQLVLNASSCIEYKLSGINRPVTRVFEKLTKILILD